MRWKMTVESLLKVMQKGTDVILKDKSEKELLRFSQGNDLNAVSFEYLNRKILVLEPHGNSFTAILEDSK